MKYQHDSLCDFLLLGGARPGLLGVVRRGVLRMPPVHDPHTLHGIQHHLEPTLIPLLLPALKRRVLKQQADTMVAHVCADVDCKLKQRQKQGSLS